MFPGVQKAGEHEGAKGPLVDGARAGPSTTAGCITGEGTLISLGRLWNLDEAVVSTPAGTLAYRRASFYKSRRSWARMVSTCSGLTSASSLISASVEARAIASAYQCPVAGARDRYGGSNGAHEWHRQATRHGPPKPHLERRGAGALRPAGQHRS